MPIRIATQINETNFDILEQVSNAEVGLSDENEEMGPYGNTAAIL